jgi:outer membrane protein OmpA-like peptidoglycan-associated protein
MNTNHLSKASLSLSTLVVLLLLTHLLLAQDLKTTSAQQTQTVSDNSSQPDLSGKKFKLNGTVIKRDANSFMVRDYTGVDILVYLLDDTRISEKKGNPFRSGKKYSTANILRGLNVDIEGRMDSLGRAYAQKVRFSDNDFRVANSIENRVMPVESRVGASEVRISQVEQNSQRISGQLEELSAVANIAKGGARAAQETADFAISAVNATNERIVALDDYFPQETTSIRFKVNSAQLSADGKRQLDDLAKKALALKGYMIEVTGFTDSTGSLEHNRELSQRRADAVVRYLAENHGIPLRRITIPFGYGETQSITDNSTASARAENRRVEVKILVNRGITQDVRANVPPRQ